MDQQQQQPEAIQDQYRQASIIRQVVDVELRSHRNGILNSALELLHQDIKNAELACPDVDADAYMVRANAYALALFDNGYHRLAQMLYERMAQIIGNFRGDDPKADDWRHLGAVYINLGVLQALEGDLDRAVPNFIRTQEDDRRTYNREGPLIEDYYERFIRTPGLNDMYRICAAMYDSVMVSPLDQGLLRSLSSFLDFDKWEYTLIATIRSLARNSEENDRTPNLYSKLQMLHGLSNLCLLFEATVKRIAQVNTDPNVQARYSSRGAHFTLKAALKVLYEGEGTWWNLLDSDWHRRTSFDQTQPGIEDFETKLLRLLGMPVSSNDDLRVKSIFVTDLVRNYLGHELDVNSSITEKHYRECLMFALLSIILVYQKAQSQAQI